MFFVFRHHCRCTIMVVAGNFNTRKIKMAMERRLQQFKLSFEESVNTHDRVVFKSEAKKAIKSSGIKLRREMLDGYVKDLKKLNLPTEHEENIGFDYEQKLDNFMKLVINYSSICTTLKEVLMVVGGLAAMVATGYLIYYFVVTYGLTACLAGLTAIIQFFKNVRPPVGI